MKQEKYWMIFQTVLHGNQCEWIPSDRKLTIKEAHQIMDKSSFVFDFSDLGLDMGGAIGLIISSYCVHGTKKDAEKLADKLNKEGGSPFKFADDGSEELDWCESETSGDGVQGSR